MEKPPPTSPNTIEKAIKGTTEVAVNVKIGENFSVQIRKCERKRKKGVQATPHRIAIATVERNKVQLEIIWGDIRSDNIPTPNLEKRLNPLTQAKVALATVGDNPKEVAKSGRYNIGTKNPSDWNKLATWNNINLLFFQNFFSGPACCLSETVWSVEVWGNLGLKKGTEIANKTNVDPA